MTQPDLFQQPALTARQRGHLGAARAARRTQQISPTWLETASSYVLTFGHQQREPWLTEQARAFAESAGFLTVGDPRVWGNVLTGLAKAGKVIRVGWGEAASSNGSGKRTWQVVR